MIGSKFPAIILRYWIFLSPQAIYAIFSVTLHFKQEFLPAYFNHFQIRCITKFFYCMSINKCLSPYLLIIIKH